MTLGVLTLRQQTWQSFGPESEPKLTFSEYDLRDYQAFFKNQQAQMERIHKIAAEAIAMGRVKIKTAEETIDEDTARRVYIAKTNGITVREQKDIEQEAEHHREDAYAQSDHSAMEPSAIDLPDDALLRLAPNRKACQEVLSKIVSCPNSESGKTSDNTRAPAQEGAQGASEGQQRNQTSEGRSVATAAVSTTRHPQPPAKKRKRQKGTDLPPKISGAFDQHSEAKTQEISKQALNIIDALGRSLDKQNEARRPDNSNWPVLTGKALERHNQMIRQQAKQYAPIYRCDHEECVYQTRHLSNLEMHKKTPHPDHQEQLDEHLAGFKVMQTPVGKFCWLHAIHLSTGENVATLIQTLIDMIDNHLHDDELITEHSDFLSDWITAQGEENVERVRQQLLDNERPDFNILLPLLSHLFNKTFVIVNPHGDGSTEGQIITRATPASVQVSETWPLGTREDPVYLGQLSRINHFFGIQPDTGDNNHSHSCSVCLNQFTKSTGIKSTSCFHYLCDECFNRENKSPEWDCPVCAKQQEFIDPRD